jgi:hypothetical protein
MARRADADAGRYVGEAPWGTYNTQTGQPIWQRPQGQTSSAAPRRYNINGALVDETGRVLYQSPQKEKPITMAEAEAQRAAEEGSVEQIAQDSLQGRLDSLMQRLPREYQQALNDPNADPELQTKAAQAWERLQQQELQNIRRYTQQEAQKKTGTRRSGKPAPMGSKGPTAKLSDLKKLLQ